MRTVPLTKVKLVLNGCAAQNFPVGRRKKVAGFLFFSWTCWGRDKLKYWRRLPLHANTWHVTNCGQKSRLTVMAMLRSVWFILRKNLFCSFCLIYVKIPLKVVNRFFHILICCYFELILKFNPRDYLERPQITWIPNFEYQLILWSLKKSIQYVEKIIQVVNKGNEKAVISVVLILGFPKS